VVELKPEWIHRGTARRCSRNELFSAARIVYTTTGQLSIRMRQQKTVSRFGRRRVLIFLALSLLACLFVTFRLASSRFGSKAAKTAVGGSTNRTMAIVGRFDSAQLTRVPRADQKEASRLIHRAVLRQYFPDFSWHTVWTTPISLCRILTLHIQEFTLTPDNTIQVTSTVGRDKASKRFWWLAKGTNGWSVTGEQSLPFFIFVGQDTTLRSPDQQMDFSTLGSPTTEPSLVPIGAASFPELLSFQREESLTEWLSNHSRLTLDGGR
jgi:hypothetical protein